MSLSATVPGRYRRRLFAGSDSSVVIFRFKCFRNRSTPARFIGGEVLVAAGVVIVEVVVVEVVVVEGVVVVEVVVVAGDGDAAGEVTVEVVVVDEEDGGTRSNLAKSRGCHVSLVDPFVSLMSLFCVGFALMRILVFFRYLKNTIYIDEKT